MNFLKTSIGLTIIFLPLYVIRFKIFGFPSTLLEAFILLTFLTWVIVFFRKIRGKIEYLKKIFDPILPQTILFSTTALIAAIYSRDFPHSLGIYRAYILEPIIFYLVVASFLRKEKSPLTILHSLVISGLWISLFSFWQFFSNSGSLDQQEILQGRVSAVYNSANAVGLYLGPIIALVFFVLAGKEKKNVFYLISLFLMLTAIMLSQSRGAIVGIFAIFITFLIYQIYLRVEATWKVMMKRIVVVSIGLILLLGIWFFSNISNFSPKSGLVYPRPYQDTGVIRICLWEGTRNLLFHHPIEGAGLNGFPKLYEKYRTCDTELFQYPHNIFLNFWTEFGILGLALFIWLVISIIRICFGKIKIPLAAGIVAALVYIFAHGLFDVPYLKNDLSVQFWILAALTTNLVTLPQKR